MTTREDFESALAIVKRSFAALVVARDAEIIPITFALVERNRRLIRDAEALARGGCYETAYQRLSEKVL